MEGEDAELGEPEPEPEPDPEPDPDPDPPETNAATGGPGNV